MSLTSPKIDYIGIRDDLLTFLRANVASLNVGLDTSFSSVATQIIKGYIYQTPSFVTEYPIIMVDNKNKGEEPLSMGLRKLATIYIDIFGVVSEISEGGFDDNDQATVLMSNIEGLLRNNITFSSSKILYTRIPTTEFNLNERGIYVAGGVLNLEVQVEVI